jgi:GMP synthase (glutamine-hydrolysing)
MQTQPGKVVLIRHDDGPEDDRITSWLAAHNIASEVLRPFKGDEVPEGQDSVLASVLYGGPFNVFEEDQHPFLHNENRWIEQCIAHDVPLLGICQGAQSIARVLGAKVGPLDPEIHEFGYYPLIPTEAGANLIPDGLHVCQAHFHGFDLPDGAIRLAASERFPNQAMRYGETTWAFQFHAEVTPEGMRRWQDRPEAAWGKPGAQTRAEQNQRMIATDAAQATWFNGFLDRFLGTAVRVRDLA